MVNSLVTVAGWLWIAAELVVFISYFLAWYILAA